METGALGVDRARAAGGRLLHQAHRRGLAARPPGQARRSATAGPGKQLIAGTFEDAAAEWLRFIEQDRRRKPSTVGGYASIVRTQLLPTFGVMPFESITAPGDWRVKLDHGVAGSNPCQLV
jgi:hypothetical protein